MPVARGADPGVRIDLEAAIGALPAGARFVFVLHDVEATDTRRSPSSAGSRWELRNHSSTARGGCFGRCCHDEARGFQGARPRARGRRALRAQRLELEAHRRRVCRLWARAQCATRDRRRAQALPRSIEPPRDLWPGIETAIGRAAPVQARVQRAPPRVARLVRNAGGAAVGGGRSHGVARDRHLLARTRPGSQPERCSRWRGLELDRALPRRRLGARAPVPRGGSAAPGLSPAAVGPGTRAAATSLADGLISGCRSSIDRSTKTRQALAADPDNPALQRMLTARYQQKLALLHAALLRVETT